MLYSLVEGVRRKPFPRGKGICPYCGSPTVAKCGKKVTWHWAHQPNPDCDPWQENETEWHRQWKSQFPDSWQEIVHIDSQTNEKHVADVKTPKGLVIEFQNSPMSSDELQSREAFYDNMIWIVNGLKFVKDFYILAKLPNPYAEWVDDFVFFPKKHDYRNATTSLMGWRRSENPNHQPDDLVLVYTQKISEQVDQDYTGHHLFDWVRPRTVWYESKKPVFLDFSDENLWELKLYGNQRLLCVQATNKIALP